MSRPIDFTPEAIEEIAAAVAWYESRNNRAAAEFAAEIAATVESIMEDPERFATTFAGCRQCSLKRFPYSVVFAPGPASILVVAVAHAKRRPGYWRPRR